MKLQNTNLCELRCKNYLVILLLSMNLLWFQPTTVASALGNETDHLALLKIKESITNDPHEVMSSWNDSIHFCNWHGVTCSLRHQRVTTLNLNGNNLGGSISPYIGNLTFLRFMYLQNNSFTGKIPQEVVHLFRLQHLNLTRNKLRGEIPVNLSSCSELRIVDFTVNSLIGRIPSELGSLAKLMVLNLGVNNLTGGIPPSLGNLSSLTGLSVAYNNIAGTIPDEIGRLNTLSIFTTSSNKLTGTVPPSLYNMSSLTIISISQNQLNGTLPANIGLTLSNLKIFGIGINEFSGPIPASLSNASQLQIFDISNNNFERQVPTNLGNLQDLWWLGLGRNNLGSNSANDLDFLTSLTNCSNLQILDFSMNHFGGIISNSIGNLSTQVSELYMGGNQISGTIPTALENLVNLIVLGMEGNLFSGNIPNSLGKLQNLQGLGLRVNSLSGEIPSSIGNLTQLSEMYLSQNKLEGAIPASIVNCQKLQLLEISENKFTGPIPPQVIGLSSLTKLANFSQNSLTGSLPVEVGKLIHIIALDVSNNNLSGEIPNTIGDCQSLEYLILQDNSFQGRIPLTLTSLKGLQYVDLSQNNLTGKIPEDLQNLQFLVHLNLSFNDLEGEVPSKGVFHNASAISVIGNSKLCGGVPELQLLACPVQVTKRGKSLAFKLTVSMVCVVLFLFFLSAFLVFYKKRSSKGKQFSTFPSTDILPNVSYKSLYQATGCFSSSNLIGSGSFGSVYKGTLQEQERVLAVKVLKLQKKGASKSFINECNALRNIRHRNLVKILTCCSSVDYSGQDFKALVFEFMTNGSLDGWLHPKNDSEIQSRNLSLLQRVNVAIDVAYALHYLHDLCEQPIIHCDLKPSNVLLDNDMIAHVSDFGLARILAITDEVSQNQTSTTGVKGSIGYTAPEYGMGGEASTQGDVYSYGILVLEMFIGRRPTDEIFKDGFSLYNFVEKALPERLTQIMDPALLTREAETVAPMEEDNYQNEIEVAHETSYNENWIQMKENVHKCLLSVLKIGLACSMESPKDRTNIKDVTLKLQLIKDDFLGEGIRGASPNTMQFTGMQPSGN